MIKFVIQKEETDQTIISFLKKRFKTTPLSLIYKLFRTKKIKIDGTNVRYYHHRLKEGEEVEIHDNYLQKTNLAVYPLSQSKIYFEIIYEDQNILLVLKEHGITMPSLDNAVRYYLAEKDPAEYQYQMDNFFVLIAAHRLDKLTKGLVIYPKNPSAKRVLYQAMADKSKITKKYLATCEKKPKKILPGYISAQKMEFSPKSTNPQAKFCALEAKKINTKNNYQTLEITLHTGRKHQIRSILSYFGLPIVGDKKYEKEFINFNKGVKKILKGSQSPYEKKIALFNLLENLKVGDMPSEKKKRVDYLLKAHLYSDLAKQSMEDYKKITAENFSKAEKISKQFWRYTFLDIQTNKEEEKFEKKISEIENELTQKRTLPLQKVGPKFKIDRKSFYHLIHSLQTEEAKTLREASNYVSKKTGLQLTETLDFMEEVSKLPQHLILATDESGYPLNLAPRKELIKGSVNTEIFANFISRVEIPSEGKYYLLMDNIPFHKSVRVKEAMINNDIEPKYIEPKTEEELRKVLDYKIKLLQQEDLRKYFKDCLDFDFTIKSGH
ncbi:8147_t:CDS:2 [Racocetra fulgida]|uniref:Pseudouridylate synthase RPUSD4, mitochondrial n=1 Tax=Racocetra fulgida TaxID=60492 RepID=A0A9N8VYH2_9GLOM|nr:8147_t:CDS:2 [Racocetra fulgida]